MNVPRYMYADGTENLIVIVVKCEAAMSIIKAEITLQIIALYCVTRRGQAYKSRTKSASCARIYFSCKHFCCAGLNKSLNSLLGANSGVLSRYTACGPTFARMIMTENVIWIHKLLLPCKRAGQNVLRCFTRFTLLKLFSVFKEKYAAARHWHPEALSKLRHQIFAKPHYGDACLIKTLPTACVQ